MRVWFLFLLVLACDSTPEHQLTTQWRLKDKLKDCDEYAVRLIDMREEFGPQHQYQIRCGKVDPNGQTKFAKTTTDWVPVDSNTYEKNKWDLDRNILTRNNAGEVTANSQPPAYQYVGDKKYGEWKTDNQGNTQWIFLPLFLNSFSSPPPPIYQNDYDSYRDYRRRGETYYRPDYEQRLKNKYQNKPNFYKKLDEYKKKNIEKKKVPSFYDKLKYKEAIKDRNKSVNKATEKTKEAPKTSPPSSFSDKINKYKKGELKNKTNISGYGVKTSKRNLLESKPKPKKKPTFRDKIKKKASNFKTKVKKKAAKIKAKFKKK